MSNLIPGQIPQKATQPLTVEGISLWNLCSQSTTQVTRDVPLLDNFH